MQSAKVEAMCSAGTCPHERSKQMEVLKETRDMLPSCRERVEQAKLDLEKFIERHDKEDFGDALYEEACKFIN